MRFYLSSIVTGTLDGKPNRRPKIADYISDWNTNGTYGDDDVIVACDPSPGEIAAIEADEDIDFLFDDDGNFGDLAVGQGNGRTISVPQIAALNGKLAPRGIVLLPNDTIMQIRQKVFGA